jgi:hypothetical protein
MLSPSNCRCAVRWSELNEASYSLLELIS